MSNSFKKITVILLMLIFSLTIITGCQKDSSQNKPTPDVPTPEAIPEESPDESPETSPDSEDEEDTDDEDTEATPSGEGSGETPEMPSALGENEGEPNLKVYIMEEETVKEMIISEYIQGVVAGEIQNDWPEEAIKAQAIIARTFVLQFIDEKEKSKHGDAHISTDIEEAQAWDTQSVNDAIKRAVSDTKGMVLAYEGEFARTWFHSNAGGQTATAKEGLNYQDENPPYIKSVESPDFSDDVPEEDKVWESTFTADEIIGAAKKAGIEISSVESMEIGEIGESGRAVTFTIDGEEVNAAELRIALDSKEMKSTFIEELKVNGSEITMKGKGYGHGVGMSQWGAFTMAEEGKTAEEILAHYFEGTEIVEMWE